MAKKKPRSTPKTGTARMREMGYKQVQLWVDPKAHAFLTCWAKTKASTLSKAIVVAALREAEAYLGLKLSKFQLEEAG